MRLFCTFCREGHTVLGLLPLGTTRLPQHAISTVPRWLQLWYVVTGRLSDGDGFVPIFYPVFVSCLYPGYYLCTPAAILKRGMCECRVKLASISNHGSSRFSWLALLYCLSASVRQRCIYCLLPRYYTQVRHPNCYGIDLPRQSELLAHGLEETEIAEAIGADGVVFQVSGSAMPRLSRRVALLIPSLLVLYVAIICNSEAEIDKFYTSYYSYGDYEALGMEREALLRNQMVGFD